MTLASFSMEAVPELVGVIECGVGQLQLVSVGGISLYCLLVECVFTISGACSDLPPLINGGITYEAGSGNSRPIATYTCDNGYTVTGGSFRVCQNDGTWSGSAPTCQGEFHCVLMVDRLYCLHSHLS